MKNLKFKFKQNAGFLILNVIMLILNSISNLFIWRKIFCCKQESDSIFKWIWANQYQFLVVIDKAWKLWTLRFKKNFKILASQMMNFHNWTSLFWVKSLKKGKNMFKRNTFVDIWVKPIFMLMAWKF